MPEIAHVNHKETEEQLDQITQALPKTGCSSVLRNLEFFLLHLLQSSCAKKGAVDHGFEPRTYQANDFKIGILATFNIKKNKF
jgi:hypothetical protein